MASIVIAKHQLSCYAVFRNAARSNALTGYLFFILLFEYTRLLPYR